MNIKDMGKNIYPTVTGYALRQNSDIISVISSRAFGCGQVKNVSCVECFLTRNTWKDDDKGVPDRMTDTEATSLEFFLLISHTTKYFNHFRPYFIHFNSPITWAQVKQTRSLIKPNSYGKLLNKGYAHALKEYDASTSPLQHGFDADVDIYEMFENHKEETFMRVKNNAPRGVYIDMSVLHKKL